jgi:hypothetical protein
MAALTASTGCLPASTLRCSFMTAPGQPLDDSKKLRLLARFASFRTAICL